MQVVTVEKLVHLSQTLGHIYIGIIILSTLCFIKYIYIFLIRMEEVTVEQEVAMVFVVFEIP